MNLKYNKKIKATPKTIYNALIKEEALKSWWTSMISASNEEGGEITLSYGKENQIKFVVEVLEVQKKVVWICTDSKHLNWIGTKLTWNILEAGAIEFIHSGFNDKLKEYQPILKTNQFWRFINEKLKRYCEANINSSIIDDNSKFVA